MDNNRAIDKEEAIAAVCDYFANGLTRSQVIEIIMFYLRSWGLILLPLRHLLLADASVTPGTRRFREGGLVIRPVQEARWFRSS